MGGVSTSGTFDLEHFENSVNSTAAKLRGLWLSYIALVTYLIITVGAVTHRDLFEENPVTLPVLNVKLSLIGFFTIAPLFFLINHFYLLLNLVGLSRRIREYNEAVVNAVRFGKLRKSDVDIRRRILDSFVIVQAFGGTHEDRSSSPGSTGWFLKAIIWITVVIAPVVTLQQMQIYFLPYQHEGVTWVHRLATMTDLALLWLFWPAIHHGYESLKMFSPWGSFWAVVGGLVSFAVAMFSLFVITFPGEHADKVASDKWWRALLQLSEDELWRTPKDPVLWTLKGWLFEGRVNEITGKRASLFSRTLVIPRGDFIDDNKLEAQSNREKDKKPYDRARLISFRGRNLRGAVLLRADLRMADFTGTRLQGATLNLARLQGATLDGARLQGATLNGASLQGATLNGARLQGATLNRARLQGATLNLARLQGATLDEARLQGAMLIGASLQGATLDDARLQGATLIGARLQGAMLIGASLQGAALDDANLQGATLIGARLQGATLNLARLQGATLDDARLQGAVLDDARLQDAALIGARLQGAVLNRTSLQGATLNGASLQGATLDGARLQGATLDDARLQGATLIGARLQGATLIGARLQGATLVGARLQGATLDGARLQGATLNRARLQGATLVGARLQGATLDRARLQGATLDQADLTKATLNSTYLWRAHGVKDGVQEWSQVFVQDPRLGPVTDLKRLETEALDGPPGEVENEQTREKIRKRLARLEPNARKPTRDLQDVFFWLKMKIKSPDKAAYQRHLASFLKQLACDPEDRPFVAEGPFVAQGIVLNDRIKSTGPRAPAFAEQLLTASEKTCPGAVGISENAKAALRSIIKNRWRYLYDRPGRI